MPMQSTCLANEQVRGGCVEGKKWLGVQVCKVFPLSGTLLVVSSGSVLDFEGDAIVNAANQGCIGGGGVDGAVKAAGGSELDRARWALPVVDGTRSVRCPVGEARITIGGDLKAQYCIHAVGPDYITRMGKRGRRALAECDELLKSAYQNSLQCAQEKELRTIGFSLLSAGIFRGTQSLENVIIAGLRGIHDSLYPSLQEIHLIAFTQDELVALKNACAKFCSSS
eukprot:gnl/MRDRNA2_/MRDRNA2_88002_c0_seq1.p1 gnl/MRDRNA2_/MRDRNA2_88002_c0~~gnl/MRDRNA2_/MRDRNA2_88002_c0_seq1.p1  ORF type:complete len:242 (-),score=48.21 gnl/MRDRNA2_/MRDRNA2_88002_c0_seq1:55-729(-)